MPCPALQGAFKRVATEVEACACELATILRRRLLAAPDQAAECIQMIAKLGEPTESLQVGCLLPCWPAGLAAVLPGGFVTVQSKRMLLAPLPACLPACLPAFLLMLLRRSSSVPDLLWGSYGSWPAWGVGGCRTAEWRWGRAWKLVRLIGE